METSQACEGDFPALARLMTELGYPTSLDEMAARMETIQGRADYATFVAEERGSVVGMSGVTVSPSYYRSDVSGAIVALVVSSRFRERGVAALLVERGEQWLLGAGAKRVMVNPSLSRGPAHRVYGRAGCAQTGLRFTKSFGST